MTTDSSQIDSEQPEPNQIGEYILERKLGSGGMGTVYLGKKQGSEQWCAVKVLPTSMARDPGFVERFNREIAAMQKLNSPNIVELYDSGEDQGTYFYAMEYVAGETLTDRLHREKRIPWRETIEIGVQICRALKAAHNTGIIHRDLKPSNLLLGEDGVVKLTDFGIAQVFASAKLTVTGGVLGTAEYMSPEQAQGQRATKASDIYSLGAVLYVMLTGRPPFTGKTTLDIVQKHRFSNFDSPRRIVPEIPHWLDDIVCQCLSKKAEERYPDAYVLSLRLQEVPKKFDLAHSSGTFDVDGTGPTSETIAESGQRSLHSQEAEAAVFRDVLRAELEAEQRPQTSLGKFLDNVWVLLGLLVLLIGGAYVLSQWNRPQPEKLFAKGQELMQRPEGPAWDAARRQYFEPLLEMDEETWGPQVAPYLDQMEVYDLKRQIVGRDLGRNQLPTSPPEAILRQVVTLQQQGRYGEARAHLEALATLLKDDPQHEQYYTLTMQILEQLQQETETAAFVTAAIQRAEKLQQAGKLQQAREIWNSLLALFGSDPALQSTLQNVRDSLKTTE